MARAPPNGKSFDHLLRVRENEFDNIGKENFDLKIRVYWLETALAKFNKQKDAAAGSTTPRDNFYDFNDADEDDAVTLSDGRLVKPAYQDAYDDAVGALKGELDKVRRTLGEKEDELRDAIEERNAELCRCDEARAALETARRNEAHAKERAHELSSMLDDSQSEVLLFKAELGQCRTSLLEAEQTAASLEREKEEAKRRERAERIRSDGIVLETSAMQDGYEEIRENSAKMQRQITMQTMEIQKHRQIAEERTGAAIDMSAGVKIANAAAADAEKRIEVLTKQLQASNAKLEAEKERSTIQANAAKDMSKSKQDLSLTGFQIFDDLASQLEETQFGDDDQHNARWRENVLSQMNNCLHVLYATQTELVQKREEFVEQYCTRLGPIGGQLNQVLEQPLHQQSSPSRLARTS